jgi:hypothetical protein
VDGVCEGLGGGGRLVKGGMRVGWFSVGQLWGYGGIWDCVGSGKVVGGLVQGRFRWVRGMAGFRERACR